MRTFVAVTVLAWFLILSCYDIRQRRLPNALTLPGAAVVLLGCAVAGRLVPGLAGAAALAAMYLLVHFAAPAAMGAGDVKLAIGVGGLTGCLGVDVWFLAALAAPLLTGMLGLGTRAATTGGVHTVPHGPSMCVATAGAAGLAWVAATG
jgi:leader peptidase (prepilin peptidase)/N-methyltransferase